MQVTNCKTLEHQALRQYDLIMPTKLSVYNAGRLNEDTMLRKEDVRLFPDNFSQTRIITKYSCVELLQCILIDSLRLKSHI